MLADRPIDLMAQSQPASHLGSPQVQVAILKPEQLIGLDPVFDHERRRFRAVEHLHGRYRDLHRPGREIDVRHAGGSLAHDAHDPHDPLATKLLRGGVRHGSVVRMEHGLHDALAIAQVDERHAAVVAAVGDPAAQRHLVAGMRQAELAARVRPHRGDHRGRIHHGASRRSRPASSSVATVSCSPSARRRSVTTPPASSRSPTIAANAAPA